jgi:hypothetical protein
MDILSRPRPTERSARGTAPHVRTCVRAFSYTPNVRTLFPPVPPRMRCASTARLSFGFASGCDMKNIYPRDPWVSIGRRTLDHTVYPHTHTYRALQTNKNKKHKTQNEVAFSREKRDCTIPPADGERKGKKKISSMCGPVCTLSHRRVKTQNMSIFAIRTVGHVEFCRRRAQGACDRSIDRSIADRDDFVLIFESRPVESGTG